MRGRRWVGSVKRQETPSVRLKREVEERALAPDANLFTRVRFKASQFVEHPIFQRIIIGLILLNALTLGLETSKTAMASAGNLILTVDQIILSVFVTELLLKLFAYGLGFFKRGWNIFDLLVVGIALVPSSGPLAVLRAFRVLRVMRLISVVPAMRRVVQALLASIPGVASVFALLLLIFYVFAVICTKLYGVHPNADLQEWFGTIGRSMYSLFQIMTLESWSHGIVRPTMKIYPMAWLVFVPFILISSFAVLNLFIAVIVNAMQEQQAAELAEATETLEEDIAEQTRKLTAEVKQQTQDLNHKVDNQTDLLVREIKALRAEVSDLRTQKGGA